MVVSTDDPIEDLPQNFATASRIVIVDLQDASRQSDRYLDLNVLRRPEVADQQPHEPQRRRGAKAPSIALGS